jgi:hypothetical protein
VFVTYEKKFTSTKRPSLTAKKCEKIFLVQGKILIGLTPCMALTPFPSSILDEARFEPYTIPFFLTISYIFAVLTTTTTTVMNSSFVYFGLDLRLRSFLIQS